MAHRAALLAIVATYSGLQIWLSLWHDPWLDEAQAWLLATRADSLLDLIIIPGEGHPPLWHWLLRGLSAFLDFSQARYLAVGVAILNAWLLSRLLRDHLVILALLLGNFAVIQFWGYHFRPYGLVFTCLLSALLLDRDDHPVAATWALAVACALHFFAGFLFAFWLVWQWSKGTAVLKLLPPAVFALAFGAIALLSGLGNSTTGPGKDENVVMLAFENLGWIGMVEPLKGPVVAILTLAALAYGLRQRPTLATTLVVLVLLFGCGTAMVYGKSPWHAAFLTMLCFLAFMVCGLTRERTWILAFLLMPQLPFGLISAQQRLINPVWSNDNLYELVLADAGAGFRPERDLIGWPDVVIPPFSAIYGIDMIDGNSGTLRGPVNWRERAPATMGSALLDKTAPYWLICAACAYVTAYLEDNGRALTLLGSKTNIDHGEFHAYRVD